MRTLVFDIETVPQNEERLLAIAPEFKPASNLKDPQKIADSIAEKRSRYLADAALDWKTAHVVLIGCADAFEYKHFDGDEKTIISQFLTMIGDMLSDGCLVGGHNVKGFDLPMLINRARVLGVVIPQMIVTMWKGRPQWNENIFDTLELFTFGNRQDIDGNGVEAISRTLGLPSKTGYGSDFPALWRNAPSQAIAYNKRDVEIEVGIARACGLF